MLRFLIAVLIVGALAAAASSSQSFAAFLAAQTNNAAGVRVVVTPKSIGPGAAWEFEVTMETHTTPLTVDLTRAAVLIDDAARRYTPTAWDGDAPGGHHRKGVLRFGNPPLDTKTITLEIVGIGGEAARSFRWELK